MGALEKNIKLQLCRGIALLPVLAVLVGCEASEQSGRFVVSGSFKLKTNTGRYVEIRGSEPQGTEDRVLIRLVTHYPGGVVPDDVSESHQEFESEILFSAQNHELSFRWNRKNDSVFIDAQTFDRSEGNTFIAVNTAGGWSVFQGATADHLRGSQVVGEALRRVFEKQIPSIKDLELVDVEFPN
jgi:hypothetical protein